MRGGGTNVRGELAAMKIDTRMILPPSLPPYLPPSLPPSLPPYLLEGVQPKGLRNGLEEGDLHPRHLGRTEGWEGGREGGRDVSKKMLTPDTEKLRQR